MLEARLDGVRRGGVRFARSYEAERRPAAERIIADTVECRISMGKPSARTDRLQDTQIRLSYAGGPIVGGPPAGLPRAQRPDARHPRPAAARRWFSLRAVRPDPQPQVHVIAFAGDGDSGALQTIVARLSADSPGKVVSVAILRQDSAEVDLLEITVVRAEPEALQAVFDGEPPALVLLRPDGYVAIYRSWLIAAGHGDDAAATVLARTEKTWRPVTAKRKHHLLREAGFEAPEPFAQALGFRALLARRSV